MRNHLIRLMAPVLTLALLAGCSSKPAETNPKLPDKPVELVVYSVMGMNREALDEVIDLYETAHPNVKVKVKEQEGGQFFRQGGGVNAAAFEGGDVVLLPGQLAQQFYTDGALRDLSAVRLPQLNEQVAGVFDDLSKVDGKRYALPISITPSMMTVNQEALTRAGIHSLPVDWTLQDLEQSLIALKAANVPVSLTVSALLEPVVRAHGGQLYDRDRQVYTLDTPEVKQALEYMARLVKTGMVTADTGGPGGGIRIEGGRNAAAIMAFGGNIMVFGRGPGGGFGMSSQPYPKGSAGRSVSVSATVAAVLSTSPNPEVATDFVKEMVANAKAQQALSAGGIRPVINDAKALAAWQEAVGDRMAQATDLSLTGAYVTSSGVRLTDIVAGLATYWSGSASLEQLLPNLQSTLK